MASKDYYQTLGVGKDASSTDIKKAYRRLAKEYHPDHNSDQTAEDKFREVSEAYQILSDDQKRSTYDQFGSAAFEGQGGGGGFGGGFQGFGSSFADVFDDLFGEFRGKRQGNTSSNRGDDVRYNLSISLEEAFKGNKTKIRIPSTINCNKCGGSGAEGDTAPSTCGTCHGAGRVHAQQSIFTIERTCPTCQGAGQIIKNPCRGCSGSGRVSKEKVLSVTIPPGVEEGTRIRLSGEGEAGVRGGQPGDLYIFLSIKNHHIFERQSRNLYCSVPLPMTTAALSGTIEVPCLDGSRTKLKIPAGTQAGHKFRLKGKGMPSMRGSVPSGDLYVHVNVETPSNLSKKQRELLEAFHSSSQGKGNNPETDGFIKKLKVFLDDLKD